ncbi:hypothetical protein STEG23_000897 [Scotinomys teguina]
MEWADMGASCLEHSDVASLKASKETVCEEIQNALDVISNASQGIQNAPAPLEPQTATLGSALDELEFEVSAIGKKHQKLERRKSGEGSFQEQKTSYDSFTSE